MWRLLRPLSVLGNHGIRIKFPDLGEGYYCCMFSEEAYVKILVKHPFLLTSPILSMKRRWRAHWLVMKGPVMVWFMQIPCWDLVLRKCSMQKAAVSWPQTLGYIHLCITCMNNATDACISKCAMKQLGFINFFSTYTWP